MSFEGRWASSQFSLTPLLITVVALFISAIVLNDANRSFHAGLRPPQLRL